MKNYEKTSNVNNFKTELVNDDFPDLANQSGGILDRIIGVMFDKIKLSVNNNCLPMKVKPIHSYVPTP